MKSITYSIDKATVSINVEGKVESGDEIVILNEDDNLIRGLDWEEVGYTVQPFLAPTAYHSLCNYAHQWIKRVAERVTGQSIPQFSLEKYHHFVVSDESHAAIIERTGKGFDTAELPIDFYELESKISDICQKPVVVEPWTRDASRVHDFGSSVLARRGITIRPIATCGWTD